MVANGRRGSVVTLLADSGDRYADTHRDEWWPTRVGLAEWAPTLSGLSSPVGGRASGADPSRRWRRGQQQPVRPPRRIRCRGGTQHGHGLSCDLCGVTQGDSFIWAQRVDTPAASPIRDQRFGGVSASGQAGAIRRRGLHAGGAAWCSVLGSGRRGRGLNPPPLTRVSSQTEGSDPVSGWGLLVRRSTRAAADSAKLRPGARGDRGPPKPQRRLLRQPRTGT